MHDHNLVISSWPLTSTVRALHHSFALSIVILIWHVHRLTSPIRPLIMSAAVRTLIKTNSFNDCLTMYKSGYCEFTWSLRCWTDFCKARIWWKRGLWSTDLSRLSFSSVGTSPRSFSLAWRRSTACKARCVSASRRIFQWQHRPEEEAEEAEEEEAEDEEEERRVGEIDGGERWWGRRLYQCMGRDSETGRGVRIWPHLKNEIHFLKTCNIL